MNRTITLPIEVVERALASLESEFGKHSKSASDIRAALEQPDAGIPVSEQDNWKMVPVEPTEKMVDMGRGLSSFPDGVYRAMLAAAPQPPVVEQRLPDFYNSKVQTVYDILCDTDCIGKPRDEHWEGWQARRIVAALDQPQGSQEPVAWLEPGGSRVCVNVAYEYTITEEHPRDLGWLPLCTHSQNLNCKSNQARLATLWGYVKADQQHQRKLSNDNDLQRENGQLITSSSIVPAGWKLVPVEPTIRQMAAMGPAIRACYDMDGVSGNVVDVYRAMLAAAPQPPALDQPQSNPTAQDISDSALLGNIESPFNACMHQEHCKRWKERSGAVVEQKLRPGMVYALPPGDYVGVILRGRYYPLTTPQPPVVEQPQIDWHDMYLKERRRAEMWIAKYEQDIGKLEVAVPVAAQPPSVAARTCANCLHNKPPFGNCDGCSQQNDDADDEGNWEPIPEPQVEQEPALVVAYDKQGWGQMLDDMREIPDGTPLYTHPQPKREDVLLEVIQRLNQNPYSLTKSECIDLIKAMRTNGIGGEA